MYQLPVEGLPPASRVYETNYTRALTLYSTSNVYIYVYRTSKMSDVHDTPMAVVPLPVLIIDCLTTVKTRCPSAASRYTKPVAVYTYDQSSYQCRKIRIIGCPTNGSNVFNNMTNCMHHCPTITETTPTTTETTPAVYSTISKPHSLLSHAGKTYQEASGTGNIISSGSLIRPSFVGLLLSIFFLS